jgi:hypothetical protein
MQNGSLFFNYYILYRSSIVWRIAAFILFLIIIFPYTCLPQNDSEYEEISITLYVQGIGTSEIPALIRDQEIYLPINNVFDFLKIKNTVSPGMDSVTGYFLNPQASFLVDRVAKRILYENKIFNLKPDDLVRTETNLYLKSTYFGDVFGLTCNFNFRSLSVNLNTKIELPAIREMRLEQMRKNIRHLTGETKADTIIGRSYPLFYFGMADWSISNIKELQAENSNTRLNLALGGILAGGETKILANYTVGQPFTEKLMYYMWRLADNSNYYMRQFMAGKITAQNTSSIYTPIIGVQATNTPTSFRRSFSYYTLSDYTEPGWTVELYVNNVLVDYVKADNTGFYSFKIPLVYGNTSISLRFYGLWGEERTSQQNISIPYNFLPPKEFEYNFSAGVVDDQSNALFSRTSLNYGISRIITIGGGMEYLSSLGSRSAIPFLKTSMSLTSNILISGEYNYGVKSSGILSYHTPSNLQFELDYTIYNKDQKAIFTNYLEERKAIVSMPVKFGNFTMYSRFNISQNVLPNTKYTMADLLLSGYILGIGTNLTTNAWFTNYNTPYLFSNFTLSFSFPKRFIIRPQIQYDYNLREVSLIKCELEKQFFGNLNVNMIYEDNLTSNYANFQIGVQYEFPFAQTSSSVNYSKNFSTISQSANGSFMYDGNSNYLEASNRTSVGKCGILIQTYLDINGNGLRDSNEPRVTGLNVHINGGRIESNGSDTTIRISDLEPYTNYFIELANSSFSNIAWKIKSSTISVAVTPNQFKLIEIPVEVMGEVSGMVYLNKNNEKQGQGGVYVCIYNSDSVLVARILSEVDGYFSFLGLKPGLYTAVIDSDQLKTLQLNVLPDYLSFRIKPKRDGDIVDDLEFVLEHTQEDTTGP